MRSWPGLRLENTLKFINLETAFKVLNEQTSDEAATLRTMVELASAKLVEGNTTVKNKDVRMAWNLPKQLPVPVLLDLFETVSRLSEDSEDPALTNLLFNAVAARVVTILRKLAWRDVGQPLVESLAVHHIVREPLHLSLTLQTTNELKGRECCDCTSPSLRLGPYREARARSTRLVRGRRVA
jgi:hypothetical protein